MPDQVLNLVSKFPDIAIVILCCAGTAFFTVKLFERIRKDEKEENQSGEQVHTCTSHINVEKVNTQIIEKLSNIQDTQKRLDEKFDRLEEKIERNRITAEEKIDNRFKDFEKRVRKTEEMLTMIQAFLKYEITTDDTKS